MNKINKEKIIISFVIPALNEEIHIGGVIDSINRNVGGKFMYEVIVVDNGSTDRTVDIAADKGVRILNNPHLKIGELRNSGVIVASGEIIVFLDADVFLDGVWGQRIGAVIKRLERNPNIITGSVCGIKKDNASWIEKYWFMPVLERKNSKYINSAHLIITKKLFNQVGGFNKYFETGEDSEFSERAKKIGAKIINDPELKVIHWGYPENIRNFFRRERWHARGDYISLKKMLLSKPIMISLFLAVFLLACIVLAIVMSNFWFLVVYIVVAVLLCCLAAAYRSGLCITNLFYGTFLYYIYFMARSITLVDVIRMRHQDKLRDGSRSPQNTNEY